MKHTKKILLSLFLILALIAPPLTTLPVHTTTAQAASIGISNSKLTLKVGDTKALKISGTSKKVTWSSSKKSIVTVSSKGKVEAKDAGTATITASVDGMKLTCKVTVADAASSATKEKKR